MVVRVVRTGAVHRNDQALFQALHGTEEVYVRRGERMPPCPGCGSAIAWRFVRTLDELELPGIKPPGDREL